jgi:hypothetical protein
VAIQIPEDLETLVAIAETFPLALTTVLIDPPYHPALEAGELPVVRLEIEDAGEYVQFITYPDASAASLARAITFSTVVTQLRKFVRPEGERGLFWVSGFRPVSETGPLDDAEARFRLCLPLDKVATVDEPERVVFFARTA